MLQSDLHSGTDFISWKMEQKTFFQALAFNCAHSEFSCFNQEHDTIIYFP